MTVIADSGAIYALYDADDKHHAAVTRALKKERGSIIIPTVILAEIDYLLREFLGVEAEIDFLDGIVTATYNLEPLQVTDLSRCRELIAQYRDLDIGLADAAIVATAERLGVERILTVDTRDFRAIKPIKGKLVLLPGDE